nr:uncharacterized protein LOC110071376 [Pogona vitticeps]
MMKITYDNYPVETPENAVENQNVISGNRSRKNPQEISEVALLPMPNKGKAEEETRNDPRANAPSDSEESTYYSGPESPGEDDAIGENRSRKNPQEISKVELLPMPNKGKAEEETRNDPRANTPSDSEESTYYSGPESPGEDDAIGENRSRKNPQEISEVALLPMPNKGKAEEETRNDPRANIPSDSEESTYYSGPESPGEDDAIGENRSRKNPQEISKVELLPMTNKGKAEEETRNDPRANVPSDSEESTYYSCPESPGEDDTIGENRSGEIPEVEFSPILHEGKEEKKSGDDLRSDAPPTLDETLYLLHPDKSVSRAASPSASHQSHYDLPTNQQNQIFFQILKDLLKNSLGQWSAVGKRLWTPALVYGNTGVRHSGEHILELIYMNKKCELRILNSDRICQWKQTLKTGDIYLKLRGNHVEHLNLETIQNVQNELESLGIQDNRIQSCFSLAKTKFMEELSYVQSNMKLDIICDMVIIAFSEGEGENAAKVLYDDVLSSPKYFMKVKDVWVMILRYLFFHLSEIEHFLTPHVKTLFEKLFDKLMRVVGLSVSLA